MIYYTRHNHQLQQNEIIVFISFVTYLRIDMHHSMPNNLVNMLLRPRTISTTTSLNVIFVFPSVESFHCRYFDVSMCCNEKKEI